MGLQLITAPTDYPVTLAEVKAWCRVSAEFPDSLLETLRKSATREAEQFTQRGFCEQTWKLTLDEFTDAIELPRGPVSAVTGIEYLDAAGALQTLDTGVYFADLTSEPQWIVLVDGEAWPETASAVNAVRITFTVGYTPVEMLDDVKTAILQTCAAMLDDPQDGGLTDAAARRLHPHRRIAI